jgi:uncharacterized protein GlcG (DUF336 family)
MRLDLTLAALVALASVQAYGQAPPPATTPPSQPPAAEELPLSVAEEWAHAAIAACKGNGYNVTATYMNTDFAVRLVMRADGARTGTVEIGRRKAYTVIKTGMSSAEFAASVGFPAGTPIPPPPPGQPIGLPPAPNVDQNMVILAGGLPVKIKGKLAGAVSVSGAPGGDKDVICAEAGLTKIADKLK